VERAAQQRTRPFPSKPKLRKPRQSRAKPKSERNARKIKGEKPRNLQKGKGIKGIQKGQSVWEGGNMAFTRLQTAV